MEGIDGPGTVDQLVSDAARAGHRASVRLIRDWTELGLLDYPQRRPAGKGHGSRQALYPPNQRKLLVLLLHHRPSNRIRSLARIPVAIWMYWGDDYVPLRQARRALSTWLGDARASRKHARQSVQELLRQLDHPDATDTARRELVEVVTGISYTGRSDHERLEQAIRAVFEPGYGRLHRAVGHPSAPLMVEAVIEVTKARLEAIARLTTGAVSDDEFRLARQAHLITYAEYAAQQPMLAAQTPTNPDMYAPVTAEDAVTNCCGHLLTTLGMAAMHPERAAQITTAPAPRFDLATDLPQRPEPTG